MPRYIDAEDFKHLINASSLYDTEEWVKVMDLLADTPTADVRQNVHAHWIKHEDRECWYCSHCNMDDYYAYYWSDTGGLELQDHYCPNCGAVMGERKEECEKQQ